MQTRGMEDYVTFSQVSRLLGISYLTICALYRWVRNSNYEKPPGFKFPKVRHLCRKQLYVKISDIHLIREFYEKLHSPEYAHKTSYTRFYLGYGRNTKGIEKLAKLHGLDPAEEYAYAHNLIKRRKEDGKIGPLENCKGSSQ